MGSIPTGGTTLFFLNIGPNPVPNRYGCVAGVMVSIVAFQAVYPGSIPGPRIFYLSADLNRQVLLPLVAVVAKKSQAGLEPAISASGGQRLIH